MKRHIAFSSLVSCLLLCLCVLTIGAAGITGESAPTSAHVANHPPSPALPAALVPIVARTLATRSRDTWRAHTTATHGVEFNNPAQHLTANFNHDATTLQLGDKPHDQLTLQLTAYRVGNSTQPLTTGVPSANGNRVEWSHSHGLSEWYVNSPLGLEQGFTLAAPPKSATSSQSLALVFNLRGTLKPVLKGNALEFRNVKGETLLRYGDLLAYDARQHALPARMTLTGHTLELAIDIRGARYPLTLDPMFSTVTTFTDPKDKQNDQFGVSVALSANGTTALIGADCGLGFYSDPGAAYVFTQTNGTWNTAPTASFADPTAANGDEFGVSVALSQDGTTAIIGADGVANAAGAAYVYTQTGGIWNTTPMASFTDPAAATNDVFGISVALSADGAIAVIGADGTDVGFDTIAGAAYVYTRTGVTWNTIPTASFTDPAATPIIGDDFGDSVALSADGTIAVIGADGTQVSPLFHGAAYVYVQSGGAWNRTPAASFTAPTQNSPDEIADFGISVALSADGNTALIGADLTDVGFDTLAGAAYVYTRTGGTWNTSPAATFTDPSKTDNGDRFGTSVALTQDGNTALIGTLYGQVAYVFTRTGGTWNTTPTATLFDPGSGVNEFFSSSVALSEDGSIALIGAYLDNSNSAFIVGAAYVIAPVLALSMSGNPSSVTVGHNVTYMISVVNNTQVTATNLSLVDTLPTGMTFVSTSAAGSSCSGTVTVTCTLLSLAPGATWQPSITASATEAGSITNTATVSNEIASMTTSAAAPPSKGGGGGGFGWLSLLLLAPLVRLKRRAA
ncbi:MAG: hypothetical protein ACRETA_03050 [Gammaproteobacteria bacterium]